MTIIGNTTHNGYFRCNQYSRTSQHIRKQWTTTDVYAHMARLFTTTFQFRGKIYNALVSLQLKNSTTCCHVQVNEQANSLFLSDNTLDFQEDHLVQTSLQVPAEKKQEFARCILSAIHHHLEGEESCVIANEL